MQATDLVAGDMSSVVFSLSSKVNGLLFVCSESPIYIVHHIVYKNKITYNVIWVRATDLSVASDTSFVVCSVSSKLNDLSIVNIDQHRTLSTLL